MAKRVFDRIDSPRFNTEVWTRKSYGDLRGQVSKNVSRNNDGTFRPSTNRSPETGVPGASYRVSETPYRTPVPLPEVTVNDILALL